MWNREVGRERRRSRSARQEEGQKKGGLGLSKRGEKGPGNSSKIERVARHEKGNVMQSHLAVRGKKKKKTARLTPAKRTYNPRKGKRVRNHL